MLNIFKANTFQIRSYASILPSLTNKNYLQRKKNKVGRGPATTGGRTAGRGSKGRKARGNVKPMFEGGQTKAHMLFPKVGKNVEYLQYINKPMINLEVKTLIDFIQDGRLHNFVKQGNKTLTVVDMHRLGLINMRFDQGSHLHYCQGVRLIQTKPYNKTPEHFKFLEFDVKEVLPEDFTIEVTKATLESIEEIEKVHNLKLRTCYHTGDYLKGEVLPHLFARSLSGYIPKITMPTSLDDYLYYTNPLNRGYLSEGNFKNEQDKAWVDNFELKKEQILKSHNSGNDVVDFGSTLDDQLSILKGEFDEAGNKILK
jgi:ribosomal protein L15